MSKSTAQTIEKAILETPRIDGQSFYETSARKTLKNQIVGQPVSDYLLLEVQAGDVKTVSHPQGAHQRRLTSTVLKVLAAGPLANQNREQKDVIVSVGDYVQIRDNALIIQHEWMATDNILIKRHDVMWNFGKTSPYQMFKEEVKNEFNKRNNVDKQEADIPESVQGSNV